MRSQLAFSKYQANGNDFIVAEGDHPKPEEAVRLCDRHKGIGADGMLVIEHSNGRTAMSITNSDGSNATMCGNGTLCAFRYLQQKGVFTFNVTAYSESQYRLFLFSDFGCICFRLGGRRLS